MNHTREHMVAAGVRMHGHCGPSTRAAQLTHQLLSLSRSRKAKMISIPSPSGSCHSFACSSSVILSMASVRSLAVGAPSSFSRAVAQGPASAYDMGAAQRQVSDDYLLCSYMHDSTWVGRRMGRALWA
jgi:hypothetical protein